MVAPEYTVSLADFKSLLKELKLVLKSVKKSDIMITCDGTRLNISTQGMETSLSGQGYWPGTARASLDRSRLFLRFHLSAIL